MRRLILRFNVFKSISRSRGFILIAPCLRALALNVNDGVSVATGSPASGNGTFGIRTSKLVCIDIDALEFLSLAISASLGIVSNTSLDPLDLCVVESDPALPRSVLFLRRLATGKFDRRCGLFAVTTFELFDSDDVGGLRDLRDFSGSDVAGPLCD